MWYSVWHAKLKITIIHKYFDVLDNKSPIQEHRFHLLNSISFWVSLSTTSFSFVNIHKLLIEYFCGVACRLSIRNVNRDHHIVCTCINECARESDEAPSIYMTRFSEATIEERELEAAQVRRLDFVGGKYSGIISGRISCEQQRAGLQRAACFVADWPVRCSTFSLNDFAVSISLNSLDSLVAIGRFIQPDSTLETFGLPITRQTFFSLKSVDFMFFLTLKRTYWEPVISRVNATDESHFHPKGVKIRHTKVLHPE